MRNAKNYHDSSQTVPRGSLEERLNLPPAIAQRLSKMKANAISAPILVENYYVILRLDKYVCATCDRAMKKRLINELFEVWMQQQLTKLEVIFIMLAFGIIAGFFGINNLMNNIIYLDL